MSSQTTLVELPAVVRTFEQYAMVDFAIGDNDPVYFAVVEANDLWGTPWASRFCVAMMTYYHMGTAVTAADQEGKHFWDYLKSRFNEAPRGAARRHFRGNNGLAGLASMEKYAAVPEIFFDKMPSSFLGIKDQCGKHLYGFGPYFWLKIADYMDRCLGFSIDYTGLDKHLSTEPARAAAQLHPDMPIPMAFNAACNRIYRQNLLAPPTYNRLVGPAEVETALCDWSHAKKGTNWLGADLIVKRDALKGYGGKAAMMSDWLPTLVPRERFMLSLI